MTTETAETTEEATAPEVDAQAEAAAVEAKRARHEQLKDRLLLPLLLPVLLIVGFFVWMNRRAQGQMSGIMSIGRSRAKTYTTERPATLFTDVAGYEGVKREIREVVDFLKEPERFLAVMEGTIILSGSHPLTRPRPLAPELSPATVAIVDAMQTSLSAGGAASGSGAAVAAAGEAEVPPPPAPVPIPVESLPSLKGVVLLQVKRYASTALGVCARQVRDAH